MAQRVEIWLWLLLMGSLIFVAGGNRERAGPGDDSAARQIVAPEVEKDVLAAPKEKKKGGDAAPPDRWKEFATWRKGKSVLLIDTPEKRFDFASQSHEDQTEILKFADEYDGKPFDPQEVVLVSPLRRFARFYDWALIMKISSERKDIFHVNAFIKALDPPPEKIEQIRMECVVHWRQHGDLEQRIEVARDLRERGLSRLSKNDQEYVLSRRVLFGLF